VSPVETERLRFLLTVLGIVLVWVGLGIEAGPLAVLLLAVITAIPLAIGVRTGLRRRKEREQSPPTPTEERDRARESYATLRWSPMIDVIGPPLVAALIIWQFGFSAATALMFAGLAILMVNGIPVHLRLVRELRAKAALD
jgi:hypothetical protein